MKLFHTSDWHLGRMLYGRSLLKDQQYFFENEFLPAVEKEKPACVLIAGDINDRQIASVEAIKLFDSILSRLIETDCTVCAISGNHDGAERIAILKDVLRGAGVHLATSLSDALSPVLIEESGKKAQIFLLPYFEPAAVREFFEDDTLRGEAACMKRMIDEMTPKFEPDAAHILVVHCFAAGSQTSESESTSFVGGSGMIPPALFEAFDYVALGHLHGPQKVSENAAYSGSPFKYSVDEAHQKKGFSILNWDGESIQREHIETSPLHDVRRISGLFEDILKTGENEVCEDYVEIVLKDKEPVFRAAERLRPYYPNLLSVINSAWHSSTVSGERAARLQKSDESTIFSSFLKEACGISAEAEDLELFKEVMTEIREGGEG